MADEPSRFNLPEDYPVGRCGLVALIGRANVGKSTLLNRILEEKVSIVAPIPQTTRHVVRAILTEPRGQLVFLDTPGIHRPHSPVGKIMNETARRAVEGVDINLLVLDASEKPCDEDAGWMRRLLFAEGKTVIVLNKTDCSQAFAQAYRDAWADLAREKNRPGEADWFSLSALTGEGVPEFVSYLFKQVPEGPFLFPDDMLTDFPRRLALADIIREQYFQVLRDELPHHLGITIEELEERPDGAWEIEARVYISRSSQKGIVLGNKGRLIRNIRRKSEKEMTEQFQRPVRIRRLWVKVEPKWTSNHWLLKKMGYRE